MYFGFATQSYPPPPPPYNRKRRDGSVCWKSQLMPKKSKQVAPIGGGKYEEIISDCNRSALNTQTKDNDDKD